MEGDVERERGGRMEVMIWCYLYKRRGERVTVRIGAGYTPDMGGL